MRRGAGIETTGQTVANSSSRGVDLCVRRRGGEEKEESGGVPISARVPRSASEQCCRLLPVCLSACLLAVPKVSLGR